MTPSEWARTLDTGPQKSPEQLRTSQRLNRGVGAASQPAEKPRFSNLGGFLRRVSPLGPTFDILLRRIFEVPWVPHPRKFQGSGFFCHSYGQCTIFLLNVAAMVPRIARENGDG